MLFKISLLSKSLVASLIFTTKKVGSRYFEDISVIKDENHPKSGDRQSIDFQLIKIV